MATFSVSGIKVEGIACCVPQNIEYNNKISIISKEEIEKFIDATGVEERRVVDSHTCTSDLCLEAANNLINKLNWERSEIDILIFVSQTGDYLLPVTSAILQNKLGLSENCMAFDVPLGCSGYTYGMSIIAGMMKAYNLKKGLLLAGDTISKWVSKQDKSTYPLFGDAGSATAVVADNQADEMFFDVGTDGGGYKAIVIQDGASRNMVSSTSMNQIEVNEGIIRNQCQLHLDGMDVFSFGISQAPKTVNNLLNKFNIDKDTVNYFVFHQANLMMNKMIAKKLKLPAEKVPYSLRKFGNTSSATIPLTIVTELADNLAIGPNDLIMCGFGVGLSWATAKITFGSNIILHYSEI